MQPYNLQKRSKYEQSNSLASEWNGHSSLPERLCKEFIDFFKNKTTTRLFLAN